MRDLAIWKSLKSERKVEIVKFLYRVFMDLTLQ